ncbi:MAG: MAPEG family protein [Pseudomonadota bacterium]
MTLELWSLLGVTVIFWLSVFVQQIQIDKVGGTKYALSNRDQGHTFEGATVLTGRLTRNVRNHVEGLVLFTPLVVIASVSDTSNFWTQTAALVFLCTRALHFLFYAGGITPFRSFAWGIGFFLAIGGFIYGLVSANLNLF